MSILPKIYADEQNLKTISDQVWSAIVEANVPVPVLYCNGERIVWIERDDSGYPVMREVTQARLRHHLVQIVWFYTLNGEDQEVDARPPNDLPIDILARPDKSSLPNLKRVVASPLFGPNGKIHLKAGYSPETEMYHVLRGLDTIQAVNTDPPADEIDRARELMVHDLLGDFPFTSPAELAHAVAAIVQTFVRLMITGPTPLYLIEKPTPGTGGSLLGHIICYPSIGRFPASVTQPRTETEWRYSLFSWLRDGPSCIFIDNLNGTLESSALASALTDIAFRCRIIGSSNAASVPVDCLWLCSGNNPILSQEMARRAVRIRLDAGIEHPDVGRQFRHKDLRGWVAEKRPEIIWACLTLIQAWIAAGCPVGDVTPLGSYESWSKVMGGILMVAGIEGFLANREEVKRFSSTESPSLMPFLHSWWELHKGQPVGAADLVQCAGELIGGGEVHSTLIRLGKWLRAQRDRRFGDFIIKNTGQDQHAQRYQLQRVASDNLSRPAWKRIENWWA